MKKHLGRLLLLSLCVLPCPRSAPGLCVSMPLEQSIGLAEVVFAGTVTGIRTYRTPLTILTEYQFGTVRYAKGSGPDSGLVLAQVGGQVGSMSIISEHSVTFLLGHRYVVFAGNWAGYLSPMACGPWHPFEVRSDSAFAFPVVCSGGSSVAFFDEHHIVFVRDEAWEPNPSLVTIDVNGRIIPQSRPPRRSLAEELQDSDDQLRREPYKVPRVGWLHDLVHAITLWPHQDPGTRVTEEELLGRLAAIEARRANLEGDSARTR